MKDCDREKVNKLTKEELFHIVRDATDCLESFKRCNAAHNCERKTGKEPCYVCKRIARKLGLPVEGD